MKFRALGPSSNAGLKNKYNTLPMSNKYDDADADADADSIISQPCADARVAIIGASYAGLTLANVLHSKNIPYTVFDSKYFPFTYITGTFDVPSYTFVLKSLGLIQEKNEDIDIPVPTREQVISILLKRVKDHNNIVFGQNITKIERVVKGGVDNHVEFYLHSRTNHTGYYSYRNHNDPSTTTKNNKSSYDGQHECAHVCGNLYGPFQCVVGADGVLSKCRKHAWTGTYLIGDARWVNDRWYDLGFRRIKEGADVAMLDAIELGASLYLNRVPFRIKRQGLMHKFCARQIWVKKLKRQVIVFVAILAVICMRYHIVF